MGTSPSVLTWNPRTPENLILQILLRIKDNRANKKQCLKILRSFRGRILQHLDAELIIHDPRRYRKTIKWEHFKLAEKEVASFISKKRETFEKQDIIDCFQHYRDAVKEIRCVILRRDFRSRWKSSYFSNMSLVGSYGMQSVKITDVDIPEKILNRIEDLQSKNRKGTFMKGIRRLRSDILTVLSNSVETKQNNEKCLHREDLRRYEQELELALCSLPPIDQQQREHILELTSQFIQQLQISMFYELSTEVKKPSSVYLGGIYVIPIPVGDLQVLEDSDSGFELEDQIEERRDETAKMIQADFISILLEKKRATDTFVFEVEVKILLESYRKEMKNLFKSSFSHDEPHYTEGRLKTSLEEGLEKLRSNTLLKNSDEYRKELIKAVEDDEQLSQYYSEVKSTNKKEEVIQQIIARLDAILLQKEQERWKDVEKAHNSREKAIMATITEEDESGSDEDKEYIEKITHAQEAIMKKLKDDAKPEAETTTKKHGSPQAVKEQISECRKIDKEYREAITTKIIAEKEKAKGVNAVDVLETPTDESDDDSFEEINSITERMDAKYKEIEEILDDSDDDGMIPESEEDHLTDKLERIVHELQKLVHDLVTAKTNALNSLLLEIKATMNGMHQDFADVKKDVHTMKSDLKEQGKTGEIVESIISRILDNQVRLLEKFDEHRLNRAMFENLTEEDHAFIKRIFKSEIDEICQYMERVRLELERERDKGPGESTQVVRTAEDLQAFFNKRLR